MRFLLVPGRRLHNVLVRELAPEFDEARSREQASSSDLAGQPAARNSRAIVSGRELPATCRRELSRPRRRPRRIPGRVLDAFLARRFDNYSAGISLLCSALF